MKPVLMAFLLKIDGLKINIILLIATMSGKTNRLNRYILLPLFLLFGILHAQKKFTIVLDPGHGGSDHGANRNYSDIGYIAEKDITLAITLKVGRMLEKNKDFKVIYTRKTDEFPSLTERTTLANRSKADLFISIHCNANVKTAPYGTETFVQGPDQNRTNLEVAKAENDVIFLDAKDRETFASYDPTSPESLIALKIQQSRYLERSLLFGSFVEDNFTNKDKRLSRGVKQQNLHVLRMNAMPSVLIETGFISNYDEAHYLASDKGQDEVAESIYNAVQSYKKGFDRKCGTIAARPEKPAETPLKNDFRILLMSSPTKYAAKQLVDEKISELAGKGVNVEEIEKQTKSTDEKIEALEKELEKLPEVKAKLVSKYTEEKQKQLLENQKLDYVKERADENAKLFGAVPHFEEEKLEIAEIELAEEVENKVSFSRRR